MSGQKQPIELVLAKGKKNLTKAEIKERMSSEIKPIREGIEAPDYLTKKQKSEFNKIANQLDELKIMSVTDVDALARYIISYDFYLHSVKQLRKSDVKNDPYSFDKWSKIQERYFKQCRSSANDLGLSITSRCKIVVPTNNAPPPKENKFKKFEKELGKSG